MKRLVAIIMIVCTVFCSSSLTMAATVESDKTNEKRAMEIYEQKLIDCGLLKAEDTIVCKASSKSVNKLSSYSLDSGETKFSNIVSYIEDDGELVDAYYYIERSVATGREAELRNTDILGFVITITYDYYYPSDNGWNYPYYKHGVMDIQASSKVSNYSVGNFNCAYVSRGLRTDSEGSYTAEFVTTASRIHDDNLIRGEHYVSSSGDNGNPYLWKNGSTAIDGCAFSGVAYSFYFGGKTFSDIMIIMHDEGKDFADWPNFDWGIPFS